MTSPLRILVTADPELPVPPRLYGGIERIIDLLIDGLVRRGHDVTLVAHRDSSVRCELVPYPGTRSDATMDTISHATLVARTAMRVKPDIIQSFGRVAYLMPVLPWKTPKVMSYQREVTPGSIRMASRLAQGTITWTGCSAYLTKNVKELGDWRVIYNAVPIDRYPFAPDVAADAPLVFLGRIEHIKGAHVAIDVARHTGRALVLAGNVPESDSARDYFEKQVKPQIDGDQIRYIGPVDDAAKGQLLSGASALVMPVLWDEPFGIVMAEALACGTPVVGLNRGAVPEVIDHGRTGWVCSEPEDMMAVMGKLGRLSRHACRQAAEMRFSGPVLVDAYESLYRELQQRSQVVDESLAQRADA